MTVYVPEHIAMIVPMATTSCSATLTLTVGHLLWYVSDLLPLRLYFEHRQLKNDDSATLEKPPNHRLFDPSDQGLSPVLQRRQAAMCAKSSGATSSSAPIINFTLGNEALNFLRPLVPQPPIPSALPAAQPPLDNFSSTLLPSTRRAGPDMRLDNFCAMFDLGLKILDKFTTNDYLHARFIRFILIRELEEMGFTRGEIAALRDAVETWSIPFT